MGYIPQNYNNNKQENLSDQICYPKVLKMNSYSYFEPKEPELSYNSIVPMEAFEPIPYRSNQRPALDPIGIPDTAPIWFCGNAVEWKTLKAYADDQMKIFSANEAFWFQLNQSNDAKKKGPLDVLAEKGVWIGCGGAILVGVSTSLLLTTGLTLGAGIVAIPGMVASLVSVVPLIFLSNWADANSKPAWHQLLKTRARVQRLLEKGKRALHLKMHQKEILEIGPVRLEILAKATERAEFKLNEPQSESKEAAKIARHIGAAALSLTTIAQGLDLPKKEQAAATLAQQEAAKRILFEESKKEEQRKNKEYQRIAEEVAAEMPEVYQGLNPNQAATVPLNMRLRALKAAGADGIAALALFEQLLKEPGITEFEQAQIKVTLQERLPRLLSAFETIPEEERLRPLEAGTQSPTEFLMNGLAGAFAVAVEIRKTLADRAKLNTQVEAQVLVSAKQLKQ